MRRTRRYIGWAELEPSGPVVAGSVGTYTLTYHVGEYGIDDGGTLKIAWRFVSDWGRPQGDDPSALDYCTVATDGPGRVSCRWDPKGYVRPWQKCLVVDVFEWALSRGDTITVVYGDRSGGSPGTVAQTFLEKSFEFKLCVDPFGTGRFIEIEDPPVVEIVPAAPAKLIVTGPTRVARGEPFVLGVKVEDEWGNPARGHEGRVELEAPGGLHGVPGEVVFTGREGGVQGIPEVSAEAGGTYRVIARSGSLQGESNPVVCADGRDRFAPYWGDLHGQSEETVGTNSLEDYLAFARDVALLDFAGHQGNDFQITPAFWDRIGRRAREFDDPGRFVVFPGYEWSATTPAGGDRNVYHLEDGLPIHRTSHWLVDEDDDLDSDRYPVGELFAELRRGGPALVVPHIGGRPADLRYHDPELEPVIEIYSSWGQFEWFLEEALERGCRVGFVAGSDDHKGRPGASHPGAASFGVYGGLTCALAAELTRRGVWEALRARRCYATTGERIDVDVRAQDGRRWIGEAFDADRIHLSVSVAGTAGIEEVRVMRGRECVYRHPERLERHPSRLRVVWGGARIRGRDRMARWDGSLTLLGGRILEAEGYAFDSAAEGIVEQTADRVAWRSVTSGDEDGLLLDLDAGPEARLRFETGIASFEVRLGDVHEAPRVHEAGGEGLQVRVERAPVGASRSCRFEYAEPVPASGRPHPYYVRVTQVDGARAWTSPFYVGS